MYIKVMYPSSLHFLLFIYLQLNFIMKNRYVAIKPLIDSKRLICTSLVKSIYSDISETVKKQIEETLLTCSSKVQDIYSFLSWNNQNKTTSIDFVSNTDPFLTYSMNYDSDHYTNNISQGDWATSIEMTSTNAIYNIALSSGYVNWKCTSLLPISSILTPGIIATNVNLVLIRMYSGTLYIYKVVEGSNSIILEQSITLFSTPFTRILFMSVSGNSLAYRVTDSFGLNILNLSYYQLPFKATTINALTYKGNISNETVNYIIKQTY